MAKTIKHPVVLMALFILCATLGAFGMGTTQAFAHNYGPIPADAEPMYETEKITLHEMPVGEIFLNPYSTGEGDKFAEIEAEDVDLEFFNTTLQRVEGVYTVHNGKLPDVEMIMGHHYTITAVDTYYRVCAFTFDNYDYDTMEDRYYVKLVYLPVKDENGDPTGEVAPSLVNIKDGFSELKLYITARENQLQKADDAKRVGFKLPVTTSEYNETTGEYESVYHANVKVKFVSAVETVEAVSEADGYVRFSLFEDWNYMVQVENDKYATNTFPLTIKDHSEETRSRNKALYNHLSCGPVYEIPLVKKGTEHANDNYKVSLSGKTRVTGMNFLAGDWYLNDRNLDDEISTLEGEDYEVIALEGLNMYRTEFSKLAAGDFLVERQLPLFPGSKKPKRVKEVYYIDSEGSLQPLNFTQKDGKVTFEMNSITLYPNVIVYETVDKTVLDDNILAAIDAQKGVRVSKDGTDVPTDEVWTTAAEKQALQNVIEGAQRIFENSRATQPQVDAVAAAVKAAQEAYEQAMKPGKKAPVTIKTALKSVTAPAQKYTGKALKPAVTVKDAKGKVVPASAYTVTYANNKYPGTATATVKAKANSKYTGSAKATFKITAAEQGVYWLVNKKTGENLYTTAVKEVNTLSKVKKTWTNKGFMWYAPTVGDPIYRLVNKKTGDHHFTKSANEVRVLTKVKKTWTADFNGKPIFYSGGPKKVWRQYSDARQKAGKPGTHKFTTYNAKLKGWKNEGALIEALRYGKVNGVK